MREDQGARYKVIFLGPAQNSIEYINKLTQDLRNRFGLSIEAVTKMVRLAPVAIKKEVTLAEAQKYKEALEAIGAKAKVEPMETIKEEFQWEEGIAPTPAEPKPQTIHLRKQTPDTPQGTFTSRETGQKMIQCPQCGFVQPATDECIKCGIIISKFIKHQEEVKAPEGERTQTDFIGTPVEEEEGYAPWEDIANLGLLAAFFRTMKEVLFSPSRFFRKMPVNKDIHYSLFYGVIMGFLLTLCALLCQYALSGLVGRTEGMEGMSMFFTSSLLIIYALFIPFLIALGLFVNSGVLHTSLMLVGGNRKGLDATFRVVAYTTSTQIFTIIPLLGAFIALIYTAVLYIIGFRESHQITTGKAALAVFLPLIIAVIFAIIIIVMVIPLVFSLIPQMMMQQPPPGF